MTKENQLEKDEPEYLSILRDALPRATKRLIELTSSKDPKIAYRASIYLMRLGKKFKIND